MAELHGHLSSAGSTSSERSGSEADFRSQCQRSSVSSTTSTDSTVSSTTDYASRRRSSTFTPGVLINRDEIDDGRSRRNNRPKLQVRFRSQVDIVEPEPIDWTSEIQSRYQHLEPMPPYFPTMPRLLFLAFTACLLIPSLNFSPLTKAGISPIGANAGTVGVHRKESAISPHIQRRDGSPTVVCKRWGHQSAIVNGTLYVYGGRATNTSGQTSDTWNNDFMTLDLTKSWQISTPSLTGLPQPSGPPPVSLGYLWNSFDSLYLYGGEFSDSPATSPLPFSTWSYDIASSSWSQLSKSTTSSGDNSAPAGEPVQRAAEGAGVSVPHIGRGFYFGGHLDGYTTQGWSQSIARLYLTSLLEYTFPGYTNSAVSNGTVAGSDGIYRNITEGGTQDTASFPERADGVLVYIPGYGESGIILGLAGGTNETFTQMNVIDVYDIESSTWYKQSTSGPTPEIRVNPCTVALSAADGSSTQVYMYGGQNLTPYGEQKQYDDMWILTIPSFTWIQVDTSTQSNPPARAGHTCNVWNGQMVVIGGYVGQTLSCDSPGIYVFNTSSLTWQAGYTALSGNDALNRQISQWNDSAALQGSFNYSVPEVVQAVIGGDGLGSATVTSPAQSATQGPIATGKAPSYPVPQPVPHPVPQPASNKDHLSEGPNKGAIIAGVIAGVLALLAVYLGFCAWLYRKQRNVYKNYAALAQQQTLSSTGYFGAGGSTGYNDKDNFDANESSQSGSGSDRTPSTARTNALSSNNPYRKVPGGGGLATATSSTEDLLQGREPSFLGVFLNPRRSLRVVNKD